MVSDWCDSNAMHDSCNSPARAPAVSHSVFIFGVCEHPNWFCLEKSEIFSYRVVSKHYADGFVVAFVLCLIQAFNFLHYFHSGQLVSDKSLTYF